VDCGNKTEGWQLRPMDKLPVVVAPLDGRLMVKSTMCSPVESKRRTD
ncbi:hypothetical protein AVEN_33965-1, partial [Araneus ventricosus]